MRDGAYLQTSGCSLSVAFERPKQHGDRTTIARVGDQDEIVILPATTGFARGRMCGACDGAHTT